ncbi:hypothetical protein [Ruegeria sp. AU67]|uniref:hypothetical protein n=1 Tax=Ruegeria sp. AU67 TaxID=2108530 RepID=UPI000D68E717|nr:hypothetical protein [Ruegeria sp. AU67]
MKPDRITMELPTTFDGRRVGAAYLRYRVALVMASQCPDEDLRRSTALTATIAYMQEAHPELQRGHDLAPLLRLRDEILHAEITSLTRDPGKGQPPVSLGEATVRCAAIACVEFLRDGKAHGQALSAAKARDEVATILRSTGRTDGAERVRKWEHKWLPGQYIAPDEGLASETDPRHSVDALGEALRKQHNPMQSPSLTAREFLRDTVQSYAPSPKRRK